MRNRRCRECGVKGGHAEDCRHWEPPADACTCTTADGQRKTPYMSPSRALNSAIDLFKSQGYARIYPCPNERRWHVTSQPPKPPRSEYDEA